jgi:hypothetical protein
MLLITLVGMPGTLVASLTCLTKVVSFLGKVASKLMPWLIQHLCCHRPKRDWLPLCCRLNLPFGVFTSSFSQNGNLRLQG